jgi:hypothetical protein
MKTLVLALAIVAAAAVANAQDSPKDTQTVTASPTEEWQINGGDINTFNGWAETTYTSYFALHRKPVSRVRRHHRVF